MSLARLEDRAVVIAVGGGDKAPANPGLQVVFAHQAADLLVIDDKALVAQRGADAAIAVEAEVVADRKYRFHDRGVVGRSCRAVVEGRARHAHQPAALRDADATGPVMSDVVPFFGRAGGFNAPL
jgi:lactam utilization protein B